MKYCQNCGNKIEEKNKYCTKCGIKLKENNIDIDKKSDKLKKILYIIYCLILLFFGLFFSLGGYWYVGLMNLICIIFLIVVLINKKLKLKDSTILLIVILIPIFCLILSFFQFLNSETNYEDNYLYKENKVENLSEESKQIYEEIDDYFYSTDSIKNIEKEGEKFIITIITNFSSYNDKYDYAEHSIKYINKIKLNKLYIDKKVLKYQWIYYDNYNDKEYGLGVYENNESNSISEITISIDNVSEVISINDIEENNIKKKEEQEKRKKEEIEKQEKLKQEEEARKNKKIQDYKDSCRNINYKDILRNPEQYKDEKVYWLGKVLQVISEKEVRIAVNCEQYDDYYYCDDPIYLKYDGKEKLLEDDVIKLWGTVDGVKTYTTILNVKQTVPAVTAKYIELISY